jgi:hypothetical protein
VPIALALLSANQVKVGWDLRRTFREGAPLRAEVVEYQRMDRKDVTFGFVSLRVALPGGGLIEKNRMPIPYSLLHRLEGQDELDVLVLPGATQEVVIRSVANAQWKMAVIQSSMAMVAAVLAFLGVYFWNRQQRVPVGAATM